MNTKKVSTLTVDYSISLKDMITDGGYDWVDINLNTNHFQIKGEGTEEVEYKILHFNLLISYEKAKRLIEESGWELGKLEHLLAFGAENPEEQKKCRIIAPGSVYSVFIHRGVPYLSMNDWGRILHLYWWSDAWFSRCQFLVVRKIR